MNPDGQVRGHGRDKTIKGGYDAVVIGVSAGGLAALSAVLPAMDRNLPLAVMVVQHLSPASDDFLVRHLDGISGLTVKEAEDKDRLHPGRVYIAPPNYHLLVERDRTLALSLEQRVNFSRPSVDVLFETASEAYLERLIGVILTGASSDGARGLAAVKKRGGVAVVQDPLTAEADAMPRAALELVEVDHIVPLQDIGALLNRLAG